MSCVCNRVSVYVRSKNEYEIYLGVSILYISISNWIKFVFIPTYCKIEKKKKKNLV